MRKKSNKTDSNNSEAGNDQKKGVASTSPSEKIETKVSGDNSEDLSLSVKLEPESKGKTKSRTAPGIIKEKMPLSKIAMLALFVGVLASAAAGYEFFILQDQAKSSLVLSETQNSLLSRISNLEQELNRSRDALAAEVQARKDAQAEHGALNTAMEAVAEKVGRTTMAWRLAEIEYLLTVANHRLTLAQDRETAIAVFETADQRIKTIGDPALLEVRKSISKELNALRSVSEPDLSGMALSLGSLAEEVERLPLIDKERVAVATGQVKKKAPENWREIPAAVWEDIKSLVVVRRHQQPTEPLLPPGEAWFLHQNLRLKLEQSRLALLRRDTSLYRQNLEEANAWIKTFFDEESSAVQNTLNTLTALARVELKPDTPDVSESLRQLRSLLSERGVNIGNN